MSTNKLEFSALNLGIIAECVVVNLGIAQDRHQCIFSGFLLELDVLITLDVQAE